MVAETDIAISGFSLSNLRVSVVLPAPEGEESTIIRPRLWAFISSSEDLAVIFSHLYSKFIILCLFLASFTFNFTPFIDVIIMISHRFCKDVSPCTVGDKKQELCLGRF